MLMHENGLANHHNPPMNICWMVWGGFFKIRIFSIFRMHAAGDFTVVYHIWFIMYDIVLWVRVGFLHKDDRHLYFLVLEYICWLSCAKRKIYIIHARRNYFYENLHTLIITWEYQKFGVNWKIDIGCIIGHGRSTHVGIREGENGHGGLEKRERVVRGRWKGNPDT